MSLIIEQLESAAAAIAPLDIVVPYTTSHLTRLALRSADELLAQIPSRVRLLRMQRVPFPLDLHRSPVSLEVLREQTRRVARGIPAAEIVIFLTRDPEETLLKELRPESIVVIASHKRFWRTAQERLKNHCARHRHQVALIYTK